MDVNPGEVNWDGRSDGPEPWDSPMSTSEQLKVQQALLSNRMGRRSVRRIPCPLPQVRLNPSRHGYDAPATAISDILDTTRDYTPVVDWSGGIGSYSGADRNSLGTM